MIGLCHKCGFMGDSPTPAKDQAESEKLIYDEAYEVGYLEGGRAEYQERLKDMAKLQEQLSQRDEIIRKLDNVLEILLAPSEAKRLSTIAKVKKKIEGTDLLSSIRKANKSEL